MVGEHIIVVDIIRSNPSVNRIGACSLASGDKQSERLRSEIAYTGNIAEDGALRCLRPDGRLQVLNTRRIDARADRIIDVALPGVSALQQQRCQQQQQPSLRAERSTARRNAGGGLGGRRRGSLRRKRV